MKSFKIAFLLAAISASSFAAAEIQPVASGAPAISTISLGASQQVSGTIGMGGGTAVASVPPIVVTGQVIPFNPAQGYSPVNATLDVAGQGSVPTITINGAGSSASASNVGTVTTTFQLPESTINKIITLAFPSNQ